MSIPYSEQYCTDMYPTGLVSSSPVMAVINRPMDRESRSNVMLINKTSKNSSMDIQVNAAPILLSMHRLKLNEAVSNTSTTWHSGYEKLIHIKNYRVYIVCAVTHCDQNNITLHIIITTEYMAIYDNTSDHHNPTEESRCLLKFSTHRENNRSFGSRWVNHGKDVGIFSTRKRW